MPSYPPHSQTTRPTIEPKGIKHTWPLFKPTEIPERSCAITTVAELSTGDAGGKRTESGWRWVGFAPAENYVVRACA